MTTRPPAAIITSGLLALTVAASPTTSTKRKLIVTERVD